MISLDKQGKLGNGVSVEEAIANVYESGLTMDLDTEMMAFLVGVYAYTRFSNESALSEGDLKEVFSLVNTLSAKDSDTLDRRANNAIERLKRQRLLAKMELPEGGTYALTTLGKAIGYSYCEDESRYSRRSLSHYTSELRLRLEQVLKDASSGGDHDHWAETVEVPLRETISELINSIDGRQQLMATDQTKIQTEISRRIDTDWTSGIESCERMLTKTAAALEELNAIILREADSLQEVLEQILESCRSANQHQAASAVDSVMGQMEVVRNWAVFSFQEWSKYSHSVHDFIRLNVRTDPNRHLADRIKKAMQLHCETPWTLPNIPSPSCFLHLREAAFENPIEEIEVVFGGRPALEDSLPADNTLEELVQREVNEAAANQDMISLVEILGRLLPDLDHEQAFDVAGGLVTSLSKVGVAPNPAEREWFEFPTGCAVQDLHVQPRKDKS